MEVGVEGEIVPFVAVLLTACVDFFRRRRASDTSVLFECSPAPRSLRMRFSQQRRTISFLVCGCQLPPHGRALSVGRKTLLGDKYVNTYDVFLSFKNLCDDGRPTKDSELAGSLYEYLSSRGLRVFYSNVSLERLGVSAYKKAIDDALDSAQILVAVGTSASNLDSQWVRYEWDSFFNDILSGAKPSGRVFAYLHDVEIRSLPRALRQCHAIYHSTGSVERLCNFILNGLQAETKKPLKSNDDKPAAEPITTQPQHERYPDIKDVAELAVDDCPLLLDSLLVGEFNGIVKKAHHIFDLFPECKNHAGWAASIKELQTIRRVMSRAHYRIGFVGGAQVGKSSTLNALLAVSGEDSPLPVGVGSACTAVATSIRCRPATPQSVQLRYLTPKKCAEVRASLCNAIGVDPNLPDHEVLAVLSRQGGNQSEGLGEANAFHALRRFLESFRGFGTQYVKEPPVVERIPYAERLNLLGYDQRTQPSRQLLAGEAEITLDSERLPTDVSLVDLPWDLPECLLQEMLRSLDALVLFASPFNLADRWLDASLSRIRNILQGSAPVRIALTKIDHLSKANFEGEHTFFDALSRFVQRHGIEREHVYFVSMRLHSQLMGIPMSARNEFLAAALPDEFRGGRHEHFQRAIDELCLDGGLDYLRKTITTTLPATIRSQLHDDLRVTLDGQRQDLTKIEEYEKSRTK